MVAQAIGLSDAPINRATWRGSTSWATPSPKLNHPRPIARLSASSFGLRDETVLECSVEIACSVCIVTPFESFPPGYWLDASCKTRTTDATRRTRGPNRARLLQP